MSYAINSTNFMTWRDPNNRNDRTNYAANLSGNPKRDNKFGSYSRQASIIISDGAIVNPGQVSVPMTAEQIAEDFQASGIWVGITKPPRITNEFGDVVEESEGFVPTYYTRVKLNYNTDFSEDRQPKVYLVTPGSEPILLDEESVGVIDQLADAGEIDYIDLDVNKSTNRKTGKCSLYIQHMYVVKRGSYDPNYDKYHQKPADHEKAPF